VAKPVVIEQHDNSWHHKRCSSKMLLQLQQPPVVSVMSIWVAETTAAASVS
jgi:hypothetical protein